MQSNIVQWLCAVVVCSGVVYKFCVMVLRNVADRCCAATLRGGVVLLCCVEWVRDEYFDHSKGLQLERRYLTAGRGTHRLVAFPLPTARMNERSQEPGWGREGIYCDN